MDKIELVVNIRDEKGGSESRRLRNKEFIPCVLYGNKEKNILISVKEKEIKKILSKGENILVYLKFDGKETPVIIKEVQSHPVSGKLLHLDFYMISLKEKIEVEVPVEIFGESPGIRDGGILEYHLRELKVRCLPTEIPQKIEVDVSGLKIGDSMHISDLKIKSGIEILADKEEVILTVSQPTELKVEEVAAAVTEPEVIGEKEREERRLQAEKEKEEAKKESWFNSANVCNYWTW